LTSADVTTEDACSGLDLVHLELLSPPYPSAALVFETS